MTLRRTTPRISHEGEDGEQPGRRRGERRELRKVNGPEPEYGAARALVGGPAYGSWVTVMTAVPLCPSLVAVIVADPAAAPVTSPLELTVATEALLLDQVIARPVRMV